MREFEDSYEAVIECATSSVIKTVWYHGGQNELLIEFESGKSYTYDHVPAEVVRRFIRSEGHSLGKFFNDEIRGKFNSRLYS